MYEAIKSKHWINIKKLLASNIYEVNQKSLSRLFTGIIDRLSFEQIISNIIIVVKFIHDNWYAF